ncbi:MAG: gliding motility-associated C-terminal domain-containing protein [Paludibacteraceae bacterium]|nr:gliding motility-associated C-terminal domain-containing protein [Paludibacteraceae bacterium]
MRTYHITDSCGNAIDSTLAISGGDQSAPALTGTWPADSINQNNPLVDADTTGLIDTDVIAKLFSDCDTVIVTSVDSLDENSTNCNWAWIRTYTVRDSSGNIYTIDGHLPQMVVSGRDIATPVLADNKAWPADSTNQDNCLTNADTSYFFSADSIKALFADLGGLNVSYKDSLVEGSNNTNWTWLRTYHITDTCGNAIDSTIAISGGDFSAPIMDSRFSWPTDSINQNNPLASADTTGLIDTDVIAKLFTDCDTVIVTSVDSLDENSTNCNWSWIRTYTIQDVSGNIYTIDGHLPQMSVSGSDMAAPVLADGKTWPVDEENQDNCLANADTSYFFSADEVNGLFHDLGGVDVSFKDSLVLGSDNAHWTWLRTYHITDSCGNAIDSTIAISGGDYSAPVIAEGFSWPTDIKNQNNPLESADTTALWNTDEIAKLFSDCDTVIVTSVDSLDENSSNCNWSWIRTYTVQDATGNIYTINGNLPQMTVSGSDMSTPVLADNKAWPADSTNQDNCLTNADTSYFFSADSIKALFADLGGLNVSYKDSLVEGSNNTNWTWLRTYHITDTCGNAIDSTIAISGGDFSAPIMDSRFSWPTDSINQNNPLASADTTGLIDTDVIAKLFTDCDTVIVTSVDSLDENSTNCNWSWIRTYTIQDVSGNIYTIDGHLPQMSVSGSDMAAPVLADGKTWPVDEENQDNCLANADTSYFFSADEVNGLFHDLGGVDVSFKDSLVLGSDNAHWTWLRTYHITDSCGNAIDSTIAISGGDYSAPVIAEGFSWPTDIKNQNNPLESADTTALWNTDEIAKLFSDCDTVIVTSVDSLDENSSNCNWSWIRTYTVQDATGNIYTINGNLPQMTVSGSDMSTPVLADNKAWPADSTNQDNCLANADTSYFFSADSVKALFADLGGVDVTYRDSLVKGSNNTSWTWLRTYHITDSCGNAIDSTLAISGGDFTAPELTGTWPADTVLQNNPLSKADTTGLWNADEIAKMFSDCDTVIVTAIDSLDENGSNCNWTWIRTYTIKDASGNIYTTNGNLPQMSVSGKDTASPVFDCTTINPETLALQLDNSCDISFSNIKFNEYSTVDNCGTKIDGVLSWTTSLEDSVKASDKFNVGNLYELKWIFQDTFGRKATCDQKLALTTNIPPKFDCNTLHDTTMYLAQDQCELPGDSVNLPLPIAKDACTGDDIIGKATRVDGKALTDAYIKGSTTIKWTFTSIYSSQEATCEQNVIVLDTIAPTPICNLDTIRVMITEASTYFDSITYQEAKAAGLTTPTYNDVCDGNMTAVGSREDGRSLTSNYPLGETLIQWTYTDESGNSSICPQVLIVEDWTIDTLYCPGNLDGKVFSCIDEIPEAYKTFAEFKAAGGTFSNEKKMIEESFHSEDNQSADSCNMVITRIYHMENIRGVDITCEEVIYVKDTIAPTFEMSLEDTILNCTDTIFDIINISATDNCDPSPIVTVKETNNRSYNPDDYAYYNYEIVRTYTATDRCGNTNEQRQMLLIRDTISPKLDVPENWDDYDLADLDSHCTFRIPGYAETVRAFATDNCSEQLSIVQVPAAGTIVDKATDVMIYVYDVTGNVDSLSKKVVVQYAKEIAKLYAVDVDSCISDAQSISLASQKIRTASGSLEIVDDFDNEKIRISSTFSYDYYRGKEAKVENLMFSNNEKTYWHLYKDIAALFGSSDKAATELTKLSKRSDSGYYTMVITDTTSGCTDTATIYVNIKERPKVSIESATIGVCENNMIDLDPYVNCIDNMGGDSLRTYWKKDGFLFDFHDSVTGSITFNDNNQSVVFYAENECGVTSSLNSHLMFCNHAGTPMTTEDSLAMLDNDIVSLELLRANLLYSRDSILIDVHRRYNSGEILINTNPNDPARIWRGEDIELSVNTTYDYQELNWYKVVGDYDRKGFNSSTEHEDFIFNNPDDEQDELLASFIKGDVTGIVDSPLDTAYYYVTISDGLCPAVSSGLTRVSVLPGIPTAFTPHFKDGLNDVFMKHHHVMIFDRYGQKVFEGDDGWDGTFRGSMADPGVYYHQVRMGNGTYINGTIEIIKIDH